MINTDWLSFPLRVAREQRMTEEEVAEAMHKYCLGCASYFTPAKKFEVQNCPAYTCPLYQFRMGLEEKNE